MTPENARVSNYLHDLAGPGALIGVVGGGVLGGLTQGNGSFDDGPDGIAQHLASRMAKHAVEVSVQHGLAAAMHRSTEYQPCECHGFGPKVAHAFLETFTDRRDDGTRALSVPRIAGAYAGNFARLTWDHSRNAGDAVVGGAVSLGFTALFNVARELTGIGR
jgi:hypothetical protein